MTRTLLRRLGVTCIALSFALSVVPAPSTADTAAAAVAASETNSADAVRAIALMNSACLPGEKIAQSGPADQSSPAPDASASPVANPANPPPAPSSASPAASPTPVPYIGPPVAPAGPEILIPRPLASAGATPPPVPSYSPSPAGSPAPQVIAPVTAPPENAPLSPSPSPSSGPVESPSPSASPSPEPGETLGPNDYAILGDTLTGKNLSGQPEDLDGHVNIIYQDGTLSGDHAHYDGKRYIDVTGNTFLRNRSGDTTFFADAVRFDTQTQKAQLINGRGVTTQGVETGRLHFTARNMVTDRSGVTHGDRASLTTCENQRGGYHVESKTLDVYPGDKAVARSAVVYLGALAIFYLPVVVISLAAQKAGERRPPTFLPLVGYSQAEGFYVKARLGFAPSDYYYGYYRVEAYTRIGFGLGYVGTIKRRDGRRQTDINFFRLKNKVDGSENNNFALTDQENFSRSLRGSFALNYTGNYGPLVTLPPQYDLSAAIDHGDARGDRQNYSFRRQSTGSFSQTNDFGVTDHHAFSQRLSNDVSLSYTTSASDAGYAASSHTLHYNTLTHFSGNSYDYDLTFDKYDSTLQNNVQKEPELMIRPRSPLFPGFKLLPITAQYTIGEYSDPTAGDNATGLTSSRAEGRFQFGPGLAHLLGSDLSAQLTLQQDVYGTGDEKAQLGQQATLTTPLFGHVLNTISYSESHVNGPLAEPFKTIDVLGNGLKQANDVLRVYNGDTYSLSLTASTYFNRQAQSVGYQLTSRPSPRSTLLIGGSFLPGPGNGFDRTSVQVATPFGRESDLQISTFVDWKNHARLESKNIYYRHIVGECYELRASYNEDLKQVNLTVSILAFPSRAANFGIGQSASLGSIIPQSFANGSFFGGGVPGGP